MDDRIVRYGDIPSLCNKLRQLNSGTSLEIDPERLQDTLMMASDSDDPIALEFLSILLRECSADLQSLRKNLQNPAMISKICHKWIGRCAQVGLIGLERKGRMIQRRAKEGATLEELGKILDLMDESFEKFNLQIRGQPSCLR